MRNYHKKIEYHSEQVVILVNFLEEKYKIMTLII